MVELGRPQMTTKYDAEKMGHPCWEVNVADTIRICDTYQFSMATMVMRTRLIVIFIRILSALFLHKFLYDCHYI
jgi:hypothetical protein